MNTSPIRGARVGEDALHGRAERLPWLLIAKGLSGNSGIQEAPFSTVIDMAVEETRVGPSGSIWVPGCEATLLAGFHNVSLHARHGASEHLLDGGRTCLVQVVPGRGAQGHIVHTFFWVGLV